MKLTMAIIADHNALIKLFLYHFPFSAMRSRDAEIFLRGIEMVKGEGALTLMVAAPLALITFVFDTLIFQAVSLTVGHTGVTYSPSMPFFSIVFVLLTALFTVYHVDSLYVRA